MTYNVYCDESCHLEHDGINVMTLGSIWCPQSKLKEINTRIKEIKEKHGIKNSSEIKWSKVSPCKYELYSDIVDYFFDDDDLHFRCLVAPNKQNLDHKKYNQSHDDWYYKMYFIMLRNIFLPTDNYEVYIDIKDVYSNEKANKLHEILCNAKYDFSRKIIKRIQPIRSHEVGLMQLVDILIGAVCYENRNFPADFKKSEAKLHIIEKIKKRSKYTLSRTTLYREDKFNILIWDPNSNSLEDNCNGM